MKVRSVHRIIGIILLLPFFGWAITGFIFFIKPGYAAAYEQLSPKTYPLDSVMVASDSGWREIRYFRTIVGDHLIVRTDSGWVHMDPVTMKPRSKPTEDEIKMLLKDAFTANPQRYGEVASIYEGVPMTIGIKTNTGVEVSLDWNRMSLYQKGNDTDRIDWFYKIHYLQWTGIKSVDKVFGVVGLVLVLVLAALGAWLSVKRR